MITIDNQKQCTKCKEWKQATNEFFGKKNKSSLGLVSQCRNCVCEKTREWCKANPERHKENKRKWKKTEQAREKGRKWYEENRKRIIEKNRKWVKANPELAKEKNRKWREGNLDRAKELTRKWRKENPKKLLAYNQNRRALKANAAGHATVEQIKSRFQYHENRCYYCGDSESGLHVEHRIPLSRGGSNWPSNLVPACQSCNFSKHTKTEKEFINQ